MTRAAKIYSDGQYTAGPVIDRIRRLLFAHAEGVALGDLHMTVLELGGHEGHLNGALNKLVSGGEVVPIYTEPVVTWAISKHITTASLWRYKLTTSCWLQMTREEQGG